MRSMLPLLSQSLDKISKIDNDISKIDNKSTSNMRLTVSLLSQSINKVSEINNKISHDELIKKFPNTYQSCNNDRNKFELLLRKSVYTYEYMERGKNLKKNHYLIKNIFIIN